MLFALALLAADAGDDARSARGVWRDCVVNHAVAYAPQSEPAETLVRAAMGRCINERGTFRERVRRASRGPLGALGRPAPDEALDHLMDTVGNSISEMATAAVIDARAARPR